MDIGGDQSQTQVFRQASISSHLGKNTTLAAHRTRGKTSYFPRNIRGMTGSRERDLNVTCRPWIQYLKKTLVLSLNGSYYSWLLLSDDMYIRRTQIIIQQNTGMLLTLIAMVCSYLYLQWQVT